MIIEATMATTPDRLMGAIRVVEDLAPQGITRFVVYVNGPKPPGVPLPLGAEFLFAPEGDLADIGKFVYQPREGYHLTVDDDLYYPQDYVKRTVEAVDRYNREAVVSWHGAVVHDGIKSYYADRLARCHCLGAVARDTPVNVPGTGVMGYWAPLVRLHASLMSIPYMADIWVGRICQRHRVPIVALAHEKGWIRHQPIDHSQTIYERFARSDEIQTWLVNRAPWHVYTPVVEV